MRKKDKLILAGVAVAVFSIVTYLIIRLNRKPNKKFMKEGTLVCSHIAFFDGAGGSKGQNQVSNIKKLIDNNVDIVEMDVQLSLDNVPVLYHDNSLEARTNGTGSVKDRTWKYLSTVRYDADVNAPIGKLSDAVEYLRAKKSSTMFQIDKASLSTLDKLIKSGIFRGVEQNIICKGKSFQKPQIMTDAGIMWMPIIPDSYVGKMNTMGVIDEIVSKAKGSQFLEAQFSDSDKLLIDGTLAKKLAENDCRLLVVAVGGSSKTNGASFRGDNKTQWAKMVNPMRAGAIMTNYPLKLQQFLKNTNDEV